MNLFLCALSNMDEGQASTISIQTDSWRSDKITAIPRQEFRSTFYPIKSQILWRSALRLCSMALDAFIHSSSIVLLCWLDVWIFLGYPNLECLRHYESIKEEDLLCVISMLFLRAQHSWNSHVCLPTYPRNSFKDCLNYHSDQTLLFYGRLTKPHNWKSFMRFPCLYCMSCLMVCFTEGNKTGSKTSAVYSWFASNGKNLQWRGTSNSSEKGVHNWCKHFSGGVNT